MRCKTKQFDKTKLCTGDLKNKIKIYSRSMTNPGVNALEYSETLTEIAAPWAAIKTTGAGVTTSAQGTQRFDGINIAKGVTHLFYIRFSILLSNLDHANNFVWFKDKGGNEKYYKILAPINNDEQGEFIILQCTERGDASKEAATA